ncbi:MAG: hypothetical protein A3B13_02080 [Candidatus Liptonbacteria bacterium RIFCSPLOWO2_01_FULL_45_15]|uniref:Uncharacterized protein n=1 Tax=Candidatus Liptonbacteria bacterium RIFCSPLOWO2_01_FULL_45_15 TaxID=1798649 RepID=A0A1G2CEY2_9BACT|nr:MAG: hypothetical protein UT33_C0003G0009 [Candidatus Peregrinibacteria bacterium GW2011_GWC2_39_14]OGY99953.1 MAG: hypothetical protein A3B13_02080 [Candidatus Liptonbacteria bacterium RIFCSPLOWO2_01_FULL_45_15]
MFATIWTILSGAFDLAFIRKAIIDWWKERKEIAFSVAQVKSHNTFVAQIIHVGGEFSRLYTLHVFEEYYVGFFLIPAERFVGIGFNRGGDLMMVYPSGFSEKHGFVLDSVWQSYLETPAKITNPDVCHLSISGMRNVYYVRFKKLQSDSKTLQ